MRRYAASFVVLGFLLSPAVSWAAKDQLYTKVFKVDPNTFVQGLASVSGAHLHPVTTTLTISPLQGVAGVQGSFVIKTNRTVADSEMVKAYFAAAGATLTDPGKAVFFNDRLGEILVRASLKDLEIIEQAVELLNQLPPQLMIEAKFVEMDEASLQGLGFDWVKTGKEFTAIMTNTQFSSVLAAIKQRADVLIAPKVTTLSGRQTHIGSSDGNKDLTLDVLATVGPDGYSVEITTTSTIKTGHRIWQASSSRQLWDGQTLVIGSVTTNQLPEAKKMRIVFITPTIIDAAGNRLHTDADMPWVRNSIPAQPPAATH